MIVRIEFKRTDDSREVVLFGNSYKDWKIQFNEFVYRFRFELAGVDGVSKSSSKWIGWGGLKWCSAKNFQEKLNREGCQDSEPDNPSPRQFSNMKFVQSPKNEVWAKNRFTQLTIKR